MSKRRLQATPGRGGVWAVILLLWVPVLQAGLTCHIHPPADLQPDKKQETQQAMLVGPFSAIKACEQGNAVLFSGAGRCHCSFDATGKGRKLPTEPWQGEAVPQAPLP